MPLSCTPHPCAFQAQRTWSSWSLWWFWWCTNKIMKVKEWSPWILFLLLGDLTYSKHLIIKTKMPCFQTVERGKKKFNVKRLRGPEKPATRRRTLGTNQHWRPLIDRCWTNKSNPEEINKTHAAKMDVDDRSRIVKPANQFDKVTFTHICIKGFACFPSAFHLAILWKVLKHSKNIWNSKTTLSPIVMRVETGCIWKLTYYWRNPFFTSIFRWWFQPNWKICSSNWIMKPQGSRAKINHHIKTIYQRLSLFKNTWLGRKQKNLSCA